MAKAAPRLEVAQALKEDVYKDIVRISKTDRGSIREGTICRVKVANKVRHFILRGLSEGDHGHLLLDELSREQLDVQVGSTYDFELESVGSIGSLIWACRVADPGARIAAILAVWSLFLAAVGLIFGVAPLLLGR